MKKIVLGLALVTSLGAFADYRPGYERPFLRAQVTETDGEGREVNAGFEKVLTLHRQDGARKGATSVSLVEETKVFCVRAPCPPQKLTHNFFVTSVKKDSCNSTVYTAISRSELVMGIAISPEVAARKPLQLKLTDHAGRTCEDVRPHRWEAEMTGGGSRARTRHFHGSPEPVYTPASIR